MDFDSLFSSGNVQDVCDAVANYVRGDRAHANFVRHLYEYCCSTLLQNGNVYVAEFLLRRAKLWSQSSSRVARAALLEMAVFVTVVRTPVLSSDSPSVSKRMTTKQMDEWIEKIVFSGEIEKGMCWSLFQRCVKKRWCSSGDKLWIEIGLRKHSSARFARIALRLYRIMQSYNISSSASADLWYASFRSLFRSPFYENVYPPIALQCALKAEYLYHEHGVSSVRDKVYMACLSFVPQKEDAVMAQRLSSDNYLEEYRVLTIDELCGSEKEKHYEIERATE